MALDNTITPFVSGPVSAGGLFTLQFSSPLSSDTSLSSDDSIALRKLAGARNEVYLYDKTPEDGHVYEVYERIEVMLSSDSNPDAEPVKAEWSMVDFDGTQAQI